MRSDNHLIQIDVGLLSFLSLVAAWVIGSKILKTENSLAVCLHRFARDYPKIPKSNIACIVITVVEAMGQELAIFVRPIIRRAR